MQVHPGTIRRFPDCPREVPDSLLSEDRAQMNHSQSLKRLNERGGMGALEILDNIHNRRLSMRNDSQSDIDELIRILDAHNPPSFQLQEPADFELKRLYDWLMDDNRNPAITAFTSGWLRNVAREIEYRIKK